MAQASNKPSKPALDTDKHAVSEEASKQGAFKRGSTSFHNRLSNKVDKITIDENGVKTYPVVKNRYHLYVSPACPWCHRCWATLIFKGLTDAISMSYVHPYLENLGSRKAHEPAKDDSDDSERVYRGWSFDKGTKEEEVRKYNDYLKVIGRDKDEWSYNDPIKHSNGAIMTHVADLYEHCDKSYEGGYTVPILWDTETDTIVNNESAIIIEMLNSEFNSLSSLEKDKIPQLAPGKLMDEMTKVNEFIYPQINNGVYASGFARSQEAYNGAVVKVFDGLDKCEAILKKSKYIAGNNDFITLSDIRLWVTLIRFDRIYYDHFKCNLARICDEYPALNEYIYRIYNMTGVAKSVDLAHFKYHYTYSHHMCNGHRIVPLGPDLPYSAANSQETEQKTDT